MWLLLCSFVCLVGLTLFSRLLVLGACAHTSLKQLSPDNSSSWNESTELLSLLCALYLIFSLAFALHLLVSAPNATKRHHMPRGAQMIDLCGYAHDDAPYQLCVCVLSLLFAVFCLFDNIMR